MTIKQARNLKPGDKVKQKMHGYTLTVESIQESGTVFADHEFVNVICKTDDGNIMKHNHKELLLLEK